MAYTPELSDYHSSTLRRISWGLDKPMTRTVDAVFDLIAQTLDEKKICEKCKDQKCLREEDCIFHSGNRISPVDLTTIQKEGTKVKIKEVAVMASKKVAVRFNSCALSYTATADIEEGEDFLEVIQGIKDQLVEKIQQGLLPQQNNEKLKAAV